MAIDYSKPAGVVVDVPGHQTGAQAAGEKPPMELWGGDGFGFDDFLDLINPLQHIPVVNMIYREITGDKINPGAQFITSSIVGGPIGFLAAAATVAVEQTNGEGMGETVMAMFKGDSKTEQSTTEEVQFAQAALAAPTRATFTPVNAELEREVASLQPLELIPEALLAQANAPRSADQLRMAKAPARAAQVDSPRLEPIDLASLSDSARQQALAARMPSMSSAHEAEQESREKRLEERAERAERRRAKAPATQPSAVPADALRSLYPASADPVRGSNQYKKMQEFAREIGADISA